MSCLVYQIAICDDDADYVEFVKAILSECYPGRLEYHCYYTGEELLEADMQIQHPLIILDIQIGELNGTEVAKQIRRYNKKAVIVFCSGVFNPTPESFLMSPYRYIQKQDSAESAKRYLTDAVHKMMEECEAMLDVQCGSRYRLIHLNDIMYIDKSKRSRIVHPYQGAEHPAESRPYMTDLTFEVLMQRYEKCGLAYPHDSYLVNLIYVERADKNTLTLKDGTVLSISRSKGKEFLKRLNNYWGSKY